MGQKKMTERELMEKVTPGFIRWLMHYAPMFQLIHDADRLGLMVFEYQGFTVIGFKPGYIAILIAEAYENMNNSPDGRYYIIQNNGNFGVSHVKKGRPYTRYNYSDYTGVTLRPWRCALLHCLMDVYSEVCAIAPIGGNV